MWSRQHVRLFTTCSTTLGCGAGAATFGVLAWFVLGTLAARSRIWVFSSMLQNCGDQESRLSPTRGHHVMLTRFGNSRTGFNRLTKRPRLEHRGPDARSRPDHPVLDFTTGGSQALALSAVVSEEGHAGVAVC